MRQVCVRNATLVGLLAVCVTAGISGGAVHMANRHKVNFGYVEEASVLQACAVMKLMREAYPDMRLALHPNMFDPNYNPPKRR